MESAVMKSVDTFGPLLEAAPVPDPAALSKLSRTDAGKFDALLAKANDREGRPRLESEAKSKLGVQLSLPGAGKAGDKTTEAALALPTQGRSIHESIARTARGLPVAQTAEQAAEQAGVQTPEPGTKAADQVEDTDTLALRFDDDEADEDGRLQAVLGQVASVVARIVAPRDKAQAGEPVVGATAASAQGLRRGVASAVPSAVASAAPTAPTATAAEVAAFEHVFGGALDKQLGGQPQRDESDAILLSPTNIDGTDERGVSAQRGSSSLPPGHSRPPLNAAEATSLPGLAERTRVDTQTPGAEAVASPVASMVASARGAQTGVQSAASASRAAVAGSVAQTGAGAAQPLPARTGGPAAPRVASSSEALPGRLEALIEQPGAATDARAPLRQGAASVPLSGSPALPARMSPAPLHDPLASGPAAVAAPGAASPLRTTAVSAAMDSTPDVVGTTAPAAKVATVGIAAASTASVQGARVTAPTAGAVAAPGATTAASRASPSVATASVATSSVAPASAPAAGVPAANAQVGEQTAPRGQVPQTGTAPTTATSSAPTTTAGATDAPQTRGVTAAGVQVPFVVQGAPPPAAALRDAQAVQGSGASDARENAGSEPMDRIHGFTRGALAGSAFSAYAGRAQTAGKEAGEGDSRSEEQDELSELEVSAEAKADLEKLVAAPEQAAVAQLQPTMVEAQRLDLPAPAPAAPLPQAPLQTPEVEFIARPPGAQSEAASISIHHPDLGPIQLEVHRDRGRVEVHAVLESVHAEAVLRANESGIRQGVQQSGMTFSALRVRVRGDQQPTARPADTLRRRRANTEK
jgi:flagellar hook-length control protein FliK